MSKYRSSEWFRESHHAGGSRKDCCCHTRGYQGYTGKGKCHGCGDDGCKGRCHGQHGKCYCSGQHEYDCYCGGKGHSDDRHHGWTCNSHSCHHGSCRRFICDDDFRLRLGGLQNGLNFRLRQLIGCYAEFTLEDDKVVHGKICHVGSNFVEMMVDESVPYAEDQPKVAVEDKHDDAEPKEKDPYPKKKTHTMIFSLEKINHLKHRCGCPGPCRCK